MRTIRNLALAAAAGSLLVAGSALADAAKPADKPRAEQHEHGKRHARAARAHGRHGCPGMHRATACTERDMSA